jgi:hypothetical protein
MSPLEIYESFIVRYIENVRYCFSIVSALRMCHSSDSFGKRKKQGEEDFFEKKEPYLVISTRRTREKRTNLRYIV